VCNSPPPAAASMADAAAEGGRVGFCGGDCNTTKCGIFFSFLLELETKW
jgi:hypothetical protein